MATSSTTFTAAQIREIEGPLLAAGEPLMARAAAALAQHIRRALDSPRSATPAPLVTLLVGAGDNGGDALFAGAELASEGVLVEIVQTGSRMHRAGLEAAVASGARLVRQSPSTASGSDEQLEALAKRIAASACIVDGILGIGSGGVAAGGAPALRGPARALVVALNRELGRASGNEPARASGNKTRRPFVVAVDLPSGIDPDSGAATEPDAVLAADLTVTFIGVKTGLTREPGASLAGRVVLEDLGVAT